MSGVEEIQLIKFDGFDDAIVGVANVWDSTGMRIDRLVYSGEKIVDILRRGDMSEDEFAMAEAMGCQCMSREEAEEYISFNVEGGYVGPSTPIVVWPYEPD